MFQVKYCNVLLNINLFFSAHIVIKFVKEKHWIILKDIYDAVYLLICIWNCIPTYVARFKKMFYANNK
jgi:hypothetical protein